MNNLSRFLRHPLTRGLDIDDPETTILRRRLFRDKKFLRRLYEEYHQLVAAAVPEGPKPVLELGAGGSTNRMIQNLISSEVFHLPDISVVLDGQCLPIRSGSLRGIVMINVLHHVKDPRRFFSEAARCVEVGGVISIIEPWISAWSKWVFRKFHNEPCNPDMAEWSVPAGGPLSGCDLALAWAIFERDREVFESEFPEWRIRSIRRDWPFTYLLSGGTTMRSLMPGWSFGLWRSLETRLQSRMSSWAMLAHIVLDRVQPRRVE